MAYEQKLKVTTCDLKNIDSINIESLIRVIRGLQVMLDADLAILYGVETKALNQAVKRNVNRFPADFRFQLTQEEAVALRSQFVTSNEEQDSLRSQIATSNRRNITQAAPRTSIPNWLRVGRMDLHFRPCEKCPPKDCSDR